MPRPSRKSCLSLAYMTKGRINFQTLRVDNSIDGGFLVQCISTGESYDVRLKPGGSADQAALEAAIRKARAANQPVTVVEVDKVKTTGGRFTQSITNNAPADLLVIKKLDNYRFVPPDLMGNRGDVIIKNMPR